MYQKQADNSYALIKTKDEDSGTWTFDSLNSGIYRLHSSMVYAKYIPTWHPMKPVWDEALDIDLDSKDSAICNEGMLPNPSFTGPASISGALTEGLLKTAGDLLKNVRVVIKNDAGVFIKMTNTNDSGKFTTANLPVGTCKIIVDMINVPTANAKTVVLDSSNLNKEVDLTVNSSRTVTTGLNAFSSQNLIRLYPNPTIDFVKVSSIEDVVVSIYTITGILVAKGTINQFQQLSTQHLANGMYVVTMQQGLNTYTQRMIKQ